MSFLKADHPWNPQYAIPANHLDAPNRGVPVSAYTPRGTISDSPRLRPPVDGKYVPRGTVQGILPSMFRPTGEKNLALGSTAVGKSLPLPSANDPIGVFGRKAADALFSNIDGVPKQYRVAALKDVLDAIDPAIWSTVDVRAKQLRAKKGYNPRVALKKALATALANQMALEATSAGNDGGVSPQGLLGLAAYGPEAALANFEAVNGLWSSIKSAGKAVGGAVSTGAKAAYAYGKKGIETVGSLACKATKVPGFTQAAAGAAMANGAPPQAGAKGAETAKQLCSGGGGGGSSGGGGIVASTEQFFQQAPGGVPMPLILGGAALLLIVALK